MLQDMSDESFRDKVVAATKARGWDMRRLSREAEVSYDVVRELHRRPNSTTGAENAERLAQVLGLSGGAAEVMAPSDSDDLVPVYNVAASAGPGALIDWHEEVVERLAFPPGYLRHITSANPKYLAIISVKGRSMEPTLREDDVVMIDTAKRDLSFEGIFVIRDGGQSMLVKRISRASRRGFVMLVSDNRDHPPVERALDDIEVIGKVIWAGVKM
jgi:phage repressor protein C with HTH and peptisase S24 domain